MADSLHTRFDVPYASVGNLRHTVDFFWGAKSTMRSPLLVFVHGGFWCSENKEMFHGLASNLCRVVEDGGRSVTVALVEYRISVPSASDVKFPDHVRDVFSALMFLAENKSDLPYDRNALVVAGHSVGAWMTLAMLVKENKDIRSDGPRISVLSAATRRAIRCAVLVDGIYDIAAVLEEYPSYQRYVNNAIPRASDYKGLSCRAWLWADDDAWPDIYVLHSPQDEYLSFNQSLILAHQLAEIRGVRHGKPIPCTEGDAIPTLPPDAPSDAGTAYWYAGNKEGRTIASVYDGYFPPTPDGVHINVTRLEGSHNDELHTEVFEKELAEILRKVVNGNQ
ncbi:hypothetical protein MSPP1_003862 [Malassezia sp. CBS 17886]|nr:hypothetical protein MSPP1_003862 [Malassezia sp. CBS 17886]